MTTQVEQLADPVWQLLDGIEHVNTYDAEVPGKPPADQDGRVHAYAVYYPGPGWERALLNDGAGDSLDWTFRVTCVGGDRTVALWCVSRVRAALTGARIPVGGQELLITEEGNPGTLRRSDDVSPPRHYISLLFTVNA